MSKIASKATGTMVYTAAFSFSWSMSEMQHINWSCFPVVVLFCCRNQLHFLHAPKAPQWQYLTCKLQWQWLQATVKGIIVTPKLLKEWLDQVWQPELRLLFYIIFSLQTIRAHTLRLYILNLILSTKLVLWQN